MKHIRVFNREMKIVAILNKAYRIGYTLETNNLWTCTFKIPLDDPKRIEIVPKHFLELWDHEKRIGMFIVNPKKSLKNESEKSITYKCEHVLSTLHSDVLFRYHQFTNYTTEQVLSMLLEQQEVKHWRLGVCEFTRYFHYSWENEDSLLNGTFSVPKPFDEAYLWDWDDETYPFTLNLVRPDDERVDTIRHGRNLLGIEKDEDPKNIINRLYPLGYGEGVNQLGIESVNNGVPYVEDAESIAKYGIHKKVWVDRRIEDAESLKASGVAFVKKYKDPATTVSVDCNDYELIDPYKLVEYWPGKIVEVFDEDTDTNEDLRIMKITKSDIYGNPSDIKFDLGNVREDIRTTVTDLQKKQLVNDTYSQGSTNIDSRDFQDNCDSTHPAVIRFPIPDDVVNINEMLLTFETQKFRAYERAIKGGGAVATSTSSGGGSTQTSSSGGGVATSTQSGGGSAQTSSAGGSHRHEMFFYQGSAEEPTGDWGQYIAVADPDGQSGASIIAGGYNGSLYTREASGNHSHTFDIPAHTHNFEVPNHSHNLSIPNHTHDVTIPDHTHEIEFGIFELDTMPSQVTIEVDGQTVPFTQTSGDNINLIPYLSKDSDGKVQRGRYVEIKITPNNLARINATVTSRLFIQSRIGGTF